MKLRKERWLQNVSSCLVELLLTQEPEGWQERLELSSVLPSANPRPLVRPCSGLSCPLSRGELWTLLAVSLLFPTCCRAAFVTLDAKTLGTKDQPTKKETDVAFVELSVPAPLSELLLETRKSGPEKGYVHLPLEIESVKMAKQKQKAEAKRKATPVVGDMQPLMEALPELSYLTTGARKPLKREEEVARFQEVISDPQYRANPLLAISKHLSERLGQGEAGEAL
ncbi:hypothetical protein EK904_002389 [Melospiza melodia maxima]|nr:hypothetical protein EK904_002389 [Melospiza melodia maxima]